MSPVIVGIDEVGRGPWAGPLVAAAVALPVDCKIRGVKDSKKLNHIQRINLIPVIKRKALTIGIGWVDHSEIDSQGLTWANRTAMQRALACIEVSRSDLDMIIIDGKFNYLEQSHPVAKAVIKADDSFACVAAASIIAKVARDNYMKQLASIYPQYGFDHHVGYGTAQHKQVLAEYGPSPLHRSSFAPLQVYSHG